MHISRQGRGGRSRLSHGLSKSGNLQGRTHDLKCDEYENKTSSHRSCTTPKIHIATPENPIPKNKSRVNTPACTTVVRMHIGVCFFVLSQRETRTTANKLYPGARASTKTTTARCKNTRRAGPAPLEFGSASHPTGLSSARGWGPGQLGSGVSGLLLHRPGASLVRGRAKWPACQSKNQFCVVALAGVRCQPRHRPAHHTRRLGTRH